MGLLFLYLFIAVFFSFLCSIMEAVLLSITPSYIGIKLQEGKEIGKQLQIYKDDIDRPLAAILTLNTIAHTAGAAGVGAQASKVFPVSFEIFGLNIDVMLLVSAALTLVILFASEIIPKTIGANYWQKLVPFTVKTLKILLLPLPIGWLVWISEGMTKRLKKDKAKSVLSRADITAMARIGEKEGVIRTREADIIHNLLRFSHIKVKDIMTPRPVLLTASEDMSIRDFYNSRQKIRFSRIPVYKESIDNVTGFFLTDELLVNIINKNENEPLKSIKKEIVMVNDALPMPDLFNKLMHSKQHIALVVDEFGGTAGIVTNEDIIETLLGFEIMDELDNVEDMQVLARKNWAKRSEKLNKNS